MKIFALLLTSLFLILANPANAEQANRLDEIIARGTVRVATTGDYKPFSYRNPVTGDYEGIDIDLARMLSKSLGVKLELVATTWPTLMKDFADGKFDIAMSGISVSVERQKLGVYSIPYLRDGKTPITRCENKDRFQTLQQIDRPEVRLVVNPGGTNERFARANLPHAKLVVHPDNVTIFGEIVAGRADLMVTDAVEARLQQKLRPQLCAVHPDTPFDFSEKAYLLPRDWLWKAWVDQWLRQTMESGSFRRVHDKWIAWPWADGAPQGSLNMLLALMDERLKLMPDVARHKWNTQSPIEDLPREKIIIDALVKDADQIGVPAAWAEAFFRAQIEAAKTVQRGLFERWREEKAGRFEGVPDLALELRPRLDGLTVKLQKALKDNWATLGNPVAQVDVNASARKWAAATVWGPAAVQAVGPLMDGSAAKP